MAKGAGREWGKSSAKGCLCTDKWNSRVSVEISPDLQTEDEALSSEKVSISKVDRGKLCL